MSDRRLPLGAISFDIDGTMEFGEPPGVITIELVRRARALGFLIGSCSDRPIGTQIRFWQEAGIEVDFMVLKQNLEHVRRDFSLDAYLHIGDTALDNRMAVLAGFEFLHVETLDDGGAWLDAYHARVPSPGGEIGLKTPAVLLAEDIKGYRERITAMLAPLGLDLTGVADGQEAIDYIQDENQPLDLLITDLEMPRRNGWAVIESFRALRDPALPIIMQTGEAKDHWVIDKAAELGIVLIDKANVDIALTAAVKAALGIEE